MIRVFSLQALQHRVAISWYTIEQVFEIQVHGHDDILEKC